MLDATLVYLFRRGIATDLCPLVKDSWQVWATRLSNCDSFSFVTFSDLLLFAS